IDAGITDYKNFGHIYNELYGIDRAALSGVATASEEGSTPLSTPEYNNIYDWCTMADQAKLKTDFDWQVCRLTEQIWGNCEQAPGTELGEDEHNKILVNYIGDDNETLLSWFARNTGTENSPESCRDTTCGFGKTNVNGICVGAGDFSSDKTYCPSNRFSIQGSTYTNCCKDGAILATGETLCCQNGAQITKINTSSSYARTDDYKDPTITYLCTVAPYNHAYAVATDGNGLLVCISNQSSETKALNYAETQITCDGYFVKLYQNGEHYMPTEVNGNGITNYYNVKCNDDGNNCKTCEYNGTIWSSTDPETTCDIKQPTGWHVKYTIGK
ncbi:MAG: hypothetical protein IKB59_01210, partial [Alphaproteobacteria bacterium]|nr:hypothetical protein [Alphaproteobacteria bacterium]